MTVLGLAWGSFVYSSFA